MRQATRLLFLAGAVAIGFFLVRAVPRDVTLVYDVPGSGARALEVEIDKSGATVRRAEFRLAEGAGSQVSHHVRLPDGEYRLRLTVSTRGVSRTLERPITVGESGTIVVPLGL